MIEAMTKSKKKTIIPLVNHKCPGCRVSLSDTLNLYERTKCKKCKSFFFLVRLPEKFFVLS